MQAQLRVGSHTPSGGSEWIGKAQGAPKPPQRSSPNPTWGLGFVVGTHQGGPQEPFSPLLRRDKIQQHPACVLSAAQSSE